MKYVVLTVSSVLVLLGGCAVSIPPDEVIVTVNGSPILEKQIVAETDKRMAAYIVQQANKGMIYDRSSEKATRNSMRQDVINTLIERQLIIDQLKADQIEISDADVDAYFLNRVGERGKTLQQAEEELKEQGKTIDGVKEYLRYHALGVESLYHLHAENKRELSESEIKNNYETNLAQFIEPQQRRCSHILIAATPDTPESFRKEAREKAGKLLQRVKAGEDFAELAQKYSQDSLSKHKGGDRGWSTRGLVTDPNNDPFGEITFAMKSVGDISGVIETVDGYHIAKLTGIKKGRIKSFQEARWEMMEDFKTSEIRGFWYAYADMLWKKAKIEWSAKEKIRQEKEEKRIQEFNRKMDLMIEKQRRQQEKMDASRQTSSQMGQP